MSNFSSPDVNCSSDQTYNAVKDYYGKQLSNTKDLKTSACAAPAKALPKHIKDALSLIHEDISSRYYGCGLVVPECLEGCKMLDLGSGSGRDCFMLSKLVGPKGRVIGVDMTDEQLELSRKYIDYHMKKFGLQQPNVNFIRGYIENLKDAKLEDNSFDVIISNCVINLSPDKKAVLSEAYRVLQDGGEMFFSDMYINKKLSEELKKNKMLWGEGVGGALLWKDLSQIAKEIGFCFPRLVTSRYIIFNKELEDILSDYKVVSATFRLFKLPRDAVEEKCRATYKGGVTGCETEIQFDANYTFKVGEAVEVDGELGGILKNSRFTDHFSFSSLNNSTGSQKDIITDPFQFADCGKAGTSGSCCEPKACT